MLFLHVAFTYNNIMLASISTVARLAPL